MTHSELAWEFAELFGDLDTGDINQVLANPGIKYRLRVQHAFIMRIAIIMAARNKLHAAIFRASRIKRQPQRDDIHRLKYLAPVSTVFMPWHRHAITGGLADEVAR